MNIYDIAREAGVSIATVSRVVNGKAVVGGKTREKVEAVLKKYSYTPDPTARSLASKSTRMIALLADDLRGAYCGTVCHAVERTLTKAGYTALLTSTGGTVKGITSALAAAKALRADAAVICGLPRQASGDIITAAKQLPLVLIGSSIDVPGICSVVCDVSYGMMLAVSHLIERGRRDILFIESGDGNTYAAEKLREGFDGGLAMYDLSPDGRRFKTESGVDGGYACTDMLLHEGYKFDAVVCDNDATAAGVIHCLREREFDIPGDISVVGFYNTIAAQCACPALTSVDCKSDGAGVTAASLLCAVLAGEITESNAAEKRSILLPRLVVRQSS